MKTTATGLAKARGAVVRPFELTVTAVADLSPSLRRVTLGGLALRDFATDADGATWDLRIKVIVPSPGRPLPRVEDLLGGSDGRDDASWYQSWLAMPAELRGEIRTYTVREARLEEAYPEIDIDFVLHVDTAPDGTVHTGPAARWALGARPGDPALVFGPNAASGECSGIEFAPGLAGHVLLAGDETALPAIGGILRDLPSGMSAQVLIEVPCAEDFQDLSTRADAEVTWLARGGRAHGELLAEAVHGVVLEPFCAPGPNVVARAVAAGEPLDVGPERELMWDTPQYRELFGAGADTAGLDAAGTDGADALPLRGVLPFYAWIAGESSMVKGLRRYLVRDCGINRDQVAFMGYWKQGTPQH
ncbi:siderophore-interacting protein [Sinomonas halotolerans]|uniref:Siderophore-interacting protein n=1 Tax=Sinomonas halotolerans TaxID=1644133 RepID=A0ABU9X299_9MICC